MSAGTSARVQGDSTILEQEFGARPQNDLASEANPLPYLLHALNQPLTGLQCSLELAAAGTRTPEQYLRTIREGLELVGRMRLLVEALREVVDIVQAGSALGCTTQNSSMAEKFVPVEAIALDTLVRGTVDDLRPVAESRGLHIDVDGNSFPHLCEVRHGVSATLFRLFDSILSIAPDRSILGVHLKTEGVQAVVRIDWAESRENLDRGTFSAPDLGLLVARVAWLQAGGHWQAELALGQRTVILSLPWAQVNHPPPTIALGDRS